MGFGLNGERVANTPMRLLPPRRGGRTVGDQVSRWVSENPHMSQMWLNPSSPRRASAFLYSGSKTTLERTDGASPLWRGTPNFVRKSFRTLAMTFIFTDSDMGTPPNEC